MRFTLLAALSGALSGTLAWRLNVYSDFWNHCRQGDLDGGEPADTAEGTGDRACTPIGNENVRPPALARPSLTDTRKTPFYQYDLAGDPAGCTLSLFGAGGCAKPELITPQGPNQCHNAGKAIRYYQVTNCKPDFHNFWGLRPLT